MKNIDLYQGYGNTYQTFFPLDFTVNFEQSVPEDHLARTVMRVAERINIGKYVDLRKRDSYGIDGRILFCIVMYAYADRGYASLRELERLCRENVVYMFMAQCGASFYFKNENHFNLDCHFHFVAGTFTFSVT